jgi:putative hydroxymethylpyrimidine transport system ATP-binding protein
MLTVSGLSKRFHDRSVFDGFDLSVPEGGFTVMIGPSGCGKSTLFNVLTGAEMRDRGKIVWQGKPLDHLGETAAYMQQKDLLLPWFSLLDNALLPTRMTRSDRKDAKTRARKLFRRLGLEGFEDYLPGRISGGMRQRCALVRTLMFDRELVLLDEPLSALDAITRSSLQSLLLLLQSDFGKSILMITHDIEEALLLADDLVVLTRAPMRIREHFTLDASKPRHIGDPDLIALRERVLAQLKEDL